MASRYAGRDIEEDRSEDGVGKKETTAGWRDYISFPGPARN